MRGSRHRGPGSTIIRETGGGSYNLTYESQNVDSLVSAFGFRVETTYSNARGTVKPHVSLEYDHEFADASDLTLSYLSTTTVYTLSEDDEARDYGTIGIGTDLIAVGETTRLSLDYALTFDENGIRNQPIRFRLSHDF